MFNQTNTVEFGKVAVLFGGVSAERDISILSGEAIFDGLIQGGIDAVKIDTKENLLQQLQDNKIDRAFIALHGINGEDGTMQGFLKILNIPFTGSGVAGSAISLNKVVSKQIWQSAGLKTADFLQVKKSRKIELNEAKNIVKKLGNNLFIKPKQEGSSVGMSKVQDITELVAAVEKAQVFDDVLIERFVKGREYTVGIVCGEALPSISMVTPNEYYDYDAKYCASTTEYFCPSGLSNSEESEIKQTALAAFSILGCSGWGRVDFIRDASTGEFMLLEANTVPGMTKTSLLPKAAQVSGMSFSELVVKILSTSLADGED